MRKRILKVRIWFINIRLARLSRVKRRLSAHKKRLITKLDELLNNT